MFIDPKKAVSVDELLRGMIVQSGNDASIALAEVIAGSEAAFAERMNREAARLGLASTHFTNATGLSHPQHYSTATDLGRLAAALIRDFPDDYKLYSLREFRYNNITQPNRNRLLWIDPYRRRHEDRAYGRRGLVPHRVGQARRAAPDRRRAGRRVGCGARRRGAEAPQLRIPGIRPGSAVSVRASLWSAFACGRARPTTWRPASTPTNIVTLPKGKAEKLALVDDGDGTAPGAR